MKNRIGIVGGGQLGRMLVQAARPLGFHISILDPTKDGPAGLVSDEQVIADFKDAEAIRKLADTVDFLTFEIESADANVLEELEKSNTLINPTGETLSIIKDKLRQKKFLQKHDIPIANFLKIQSSKDVEQALKEFGYPIVLKARYDAYDGRGNALVEKKGDIASALKKLANRSLYVEQYIPFQKEIAVVAVRSMNGTVITYPTVETIHSNNICHIVIAPAPIDEKADKKAQKLAKEVLRHFKGAGVFGIEMFLTKEGNVLINEIAPRVHNSGHHTIESSATSQFEQHIRAVTGMPLGETHMTSPHAVMINILGDRTGPAQCIGADKVIGMSGVNLHIYDKIETRPERKMGHLTCVSETAEEAFETAKRARDMITI